mmetsp:Transcript_11618/g.31333  ORF Transcript_11618/g.31333 Transcript_11618/m.31333 type:complete len:229 (-) Transcript_11618:336-1022(-)
MPSLALTPLTAGKSTTSLVFLMASMTSIGVAAMKGGYPKIQMNMVTPTAHISHMRPSYVPAFELSHISGAKKAGVPAVAVEPADVSTKTAVPKSAILSMPVLLEMSKFSGLMSRCTMPFMCRYSRPRTRWRMWDQMSGSLSGTGIPSLPTCCDAPPSTKSMTMNTSSAVGSSMTSCMPTQLGCLIFFISAISAFTVSRADPKRPWRWRLRADFLSILMANFSLWATAR